MIPIIEGRVVSVCGIAGDMPLILHVTWVLAMPVMMLISET
jgi:hypothetical protein